MQTFLPYPDFERSAAVLDWRRLGKQRVETKQIVMSLLDTSYGWQNHPAVHMWRGFEKCLAHYGLAICTEWRRRGYNDTLYPWFVATFDSMDCKYKRPEWMGQVEFHASHRSNLLRKFKQHYEQFGWSEPDNIPYVWPKGRNE